MSLNEHFNQRAKDALNARIAQACARTLRDLQQDVARAKKLADGTAGVFARHGFNGSGSYASGVFKYRLFSTRSEGSFKFDTWYENGAQMERLLKELVPQHPAFRALHDFCAQHDHNFRIDHDIDKDMSVGMVTPTNYKFNVIITVKLREPYANSSRRLVSPKPAPKPAPAPAAIPVPAPAVTTPPAAPRPLTKAQVAQYLRNLRNEDDKREFLALLGGVPAPKSPLRVQLKKPQG